MNESLVEQLTAQIENQQQELDNAVQEQDRLKHKNQELQQELNNLLATRTAPPPDYEAVRSRVLKSLTQGRGKGTFASTSPQFKAASRALDLFISELKAYTPMSTPASTAPDGTAAPLVDEAATNFREKLYTKDDYFASLRQITERCGYRLFIDNATLGMGREIFIVSPPGDSTERVISTQDIGEIVAWLKKQNLND